MTLFVTLKNYFRRSNSYTGTCINTLALCSVYSQQFKYGIMTNGHVPVLVETRLQLGLVQTLNYLKCLNIGSA